MKEINFAWVRGDDETETLRFKQADGSPLDLSGCRLDLHILPKGKNEARIKLSTITGELLVNENAVTLKLTHTHTERVKWRLAEWDLQCTYPTGLIQTLVRGEVELQHDVTQLEEE